MKKPSIPVSEISRRLINLRKWLINHPEATECLTAFGIIALVRQELKLRSRSRKGIK